ncbi:imidazole glycerol phosphate synthase subunit HisH [Pyruvatibacter mobilis]|uniref:Imidazole glycerol phosphate synthase subunit HisH n=1 Tax=Pyruvatibacter mobilis TaxID=1712261 RepID=A0A845Q767_9HYPH|nr:imidazole glycerol phosphate synthase subunit HisH [Pyruvatibacter mobilis]NBG94395.1 imidazole glycerol phosphate synthase subunit HisH [Pyruvatibacter mobilis]QJD76682.1 imidazole glycerol phosphate synthase subunit HisH [Pyruvatibacter mobilis]GGD02620.1 imidazole glycerol phosphate synthase subunit HisH 2 [Pyruvatibacter mobilis]
MIVIVNYGAGNLKSVQAMLGKAGAQSQISSEPEAIYNASKIVLPGVGNFGYGMRKLRETGLIDVLNWVALEAKHPVLGICLGSQILGNGSEEAPEEPGLGWIDMTCHRFPSNEAMRVPRMGWGTLDTVRSTPLFDSLSEDARFYFVHSFHMDCVNPDDVVATSTYGFPYTCVVQRGNIIGTQFHPEKSHRFGLALMSAFARL